MFNNVALDVVIGLVLVYLLYSLLVTILGELIAAWFGMRARILRIAIERMLNDAQEAQRAKKKKNVVISSIAKFFLQEPKSFKGSFADTFYQYPSIKYLSKIELSQASIFGQTKPSYITNENFANTIINILSDKGTGADKLSQVSFSLRYNTLHIQPETIKHLRNLYNLSNNDLDSFKKNLITWYNETMDRANGWYKRRVKLVLFWLGFLVAIAFNVDSIKIARILSNDKEARNQLVSMGVALSKDTNRYASYIHAGKDSIHKDAIIDTGFSHVSKDISAANLILGLGWHFGDLKADKLEVKGSWPSYIWYNILLKRCNDSINKINQVVKSKENIIQGIRTEVKVVAQDTLVRKAKINTLSGSAKTDSENSLLEEISAIKKSNNNIAQVSLDIKKDSARINYFDLLINRIRDSVNRKNDKNYVSVGSISCSATYNNVIISAKKKYKFSEKTSDFFGISFFSLSFLGFAITGFALSLGAPFWFGVLNKLASIRSSGVKPDDKKANQQTASAALPVAGGAADALPAVSLLSTDALATSVEELNFKYKNSSGVISIRAGFIKNGDQKIRAIEIHAITQQVLNDLKKQIGGDGTYNSIPVNYIINTPAKAQLNCGEGIQNQNVQNIWGTLGCLAKINNDDNDYIISCWHVLQHAGNPIQTINSTNVGTVVSGGITANMDVGFGKLTVTGQLNNRTIGIKNPFRPINDDDAFNEVQVTFKGSASPPATRPVVVFNNAVGLNNIYNPADGSNYSLSDLFSITCYDDAGNTTSPSRDGDSGSIIVDINGYPLGVLVAGDANFSYAVKLSNIFNPANQPSYNQYYLPY